jgi:hypothetical protein
MSLYQEGRTSHPRVMLGKETESRRVDTLSAVFHGNLRACGMPLVFSRARASTAFGWEERTVLKSSRVRQPVWDYR